MSVRDYALMAAIGFGLLATKPANAQTIATFDNLTLPVTVDTDYAGTQLDTAQDVNYHFQSGNVIFYGAEASWGGYSGFNYSNWTDDTTKGFTNDKSAITGMGYDSSSIYGVGYVPLDFNGPDPTATIPIGAKITGSSTGQKVKGAYITNTTYAYFYMKDNFQAGNWFKLTVRGYLDGRQTRDSVSLMLGKVTSSDTELIKTWEWVDLTALGAVDSLTFDLSSNDTVGGFGMNNPAYFAIENLTTEDSTVTGINHWSQQQLAASVYPNPAHQKLFIDTENPVNVSIFDLTGKRVLKAVDTKQINVSTLAAGTYLIRIYNPQAHQFRGLKFIKR